MPKITINIPKAMLHQSRDLYKEQFGSEVGIWEVGMCKVGKFLLYHA